MENEEFRIRQDLLLDFEHYASKCLKIRTKSGSIEPLILNKVQKYVNSKLDEQKRNIGKVRAVLVKARQEGCSTLIGGRYYWITTNNFGIETFILTHLLQSTISLFKMAQMFYEYTPEIVRPNASTNNARYLTFGDLKSGYQVGTSDTSELGRASTIQLFHGCLSFGTLIYDPSYMSVRPIQDFKIGDLVLTHNKNIAPISFISSQIKECISIKFRGLSSFPLIATKEHKFFTNDGWKELGELKIGDSIGYPIEIGHLISKRIRKPVISKINNDYAWIRIKSIENVGLHQVYDFEVNHEDHSYCTIHGAAKNSEVAFWKNASSHASGILQCVPDLPGTEIILESTANGVNNYFHEMWQKAESGLTDYIPIFVPWYWQDEYKREVPKDFKLNHIEEHLQRTYGITNEQLAWRRVKIIDLTSQGRDGEKVFMQEYPSNSIEAFQITGEDTFIDTRLVADARIDTLAQKYGPLLLGVDVARYGDNLTAMIFRQGRVAFDLETHSKKSTMETANRVHMLIEKYRPDKVIIDDCGVGGGVTDRLKELGHGAILIPVNAGNKPIDEQKYYNLRAEMWGKLANWLADIPVKIPDDNRLHGDLCSIKYDFDSNSRLKMESKKDMIKRHIRSPDCADALAMTFCQPVYNYMVKEEPTSNIIRSLAADMQRKLEIINRARKG
jgi:hypothetical protein